MSTVKRFVSQGGLRVYQISCQVFANLTGRVYLLLGAGPPTLVDAGSGQEDCTRQILSGVQQVHDEFGEAIAPADIRRILITHAHIDHFGGLAGLLREVKAEVGIHPLDSRALTAYDEFAVVANWKLDAFLTTAGVEPQQRREMLEAFQLPRGRYPNVPWDVPLGDGLVLDGLEILHTPGHSAGHVCIAADNLLLSADHILSRTIPQQWPESVAPNTGLGHYLESLDKVQRRGGFDLALPAHEIVIHDLSHRIDAIRTSNLRRLERLVEILRHAGRPLSVGELARKMYTDSLGMRAILAMTDIGARVEYLHQRGQLLVANLDDLQQGDSPVFRYAPY